MTDSDQQEKLQTERQLVAELKVLRASMRAVIGSLDRMQQVADGMLRREGEADAD